VRPAQGDPSLVGYITPERWQPTTTLPRIGACLICFERVQGAGATGDTGFAGAAVTYRRRLLAGAVSSGPAGGPYLPALLALREGPLLEQAVRSLPVVPEVLVVNATGRDHPRRAGLALHLGAVLGLPTVGVTTRPRSRSCRPRPVGPAPQSPCAAPAPGGHTAAERVHRSRRSGRRSDGRECVGLQATTPPATKVAGVAGRSHSREWAIPARERVGSWVQSPGGGPAAVLGRYGTPPWLGRSDRRGGR
jgi:Endonuclease V